MKPDSGYIKTMKGVMSRKIILYIFVFIFFSLNQSFSQVEKEISLRKIWDYTLSNSPLLRKNISELEKSKTTLKQVEAMKILPYTSLDFRTGIVPGARGDVIYSPNSKFELRRWGPFFQTSLELVQPLYTFGRINNAEKAANELISIQEIKNKNLTDELCVNVVQSYWALIATNEAVEIVVDLKKDYDTLVEKIKSEINKENSDLDQSYLFEVKSNDYIINTLYNNSFSNKILAQNTFKELVGLKIDSATEFANKNSPDLEKSERAMDTAILKAIANNNEVLMIETGLRAINDKINFQISEKKSVTLYCRRRAVRICFK